MSREIYVFEVNTEDMFLYPLLVHFIWNVFILLIGTKTADPLCYGHTQFHLLPDKLKRERLLKQNCADQIEVIFRANAIASLFAWTGAQAMYQGKTSFMASMLLEDILRI